MEELKMMYECFRKAFIEYDLRYECFCHKLSWGKNTYLTRFVDNKLVAFSVVRKDSISILCVDPDFQNQGYGSSLLKESEELIEKEGFNKVNLGGGFFLACPLRGKGIKDNFFSKRGYRGTSTCYEMKMDLKDFDINNVYAASRMVTLYSHLILYIASNAVVIAMRSLSSTSCSVQ